MNWDAISAGGTILAAVVGVAGIWMNLWDKTKKININFETVPRFKVYLSNNSLRTTVITKMMCMVNSNVFYVEYFDGLKELTLPPATTQYIDIIKQDAYEAYCNSQIRAICNANDKVTFILWDNFGKKYKINTGLGIGAFEKK